jgi:predicted CXXCH cytochrome family protein
VLTCALLAALAGTSAFAAAPATKVPNPHWQKDGCSNCHTIDGGKKLPIAAANVDGVCLKCHDGRKASAEFHPVGRAFDNQKYIKPKDWPLVEERMVCNTCHDVKIACVEEINRPASNRMLLRDFSATRNQAQPFCRNCHQAEAYQKINPHIMLLAEKDEIIEDKCLFCHNKPLDRQTLARTGDSALKIEQQLLCRDCHPQHKDQMIQGHAGVKISPDMLATMYLRELTGLQATMGTSTVSQAVAAGKKPVKMIPAADGAIVCSTCHNPHQYGVFPKDSVLSYRAMRQMGKNRMVSPVRGQTWCRHCHEF